MNQRARAHTHKHVIGWPNRQARWHTYLSDSSLWSHFIFRAAPLSLGAEVAGFVAMQAFSPSVRSRLCLEPSEARDIIDSKKSLPVSSLPSPPSNECSRTRNDTAFGLHFGLAEPLLGLALCCNAAFKLRALVCGKDTQPEMEAGDYSPKADGNSVVLTGGGVPLDRHCGSTKVLCTRTIGMHCCGYRTSVIHSHRLLCFACADLDHHHL